MVEINTEKMIHLIDRVKSQIHCLNEISSDLSLWIKFEQKSDGLDEEIIETVKRQSYELDQTIKSVKKVMSSMNKTVVACITAQRRALEIVENVDGYFSGKHKKENLKLNDLTAISKILSVYNFDVR